MPVPKAVAVLAVPTIISQLITTIYNLADTWFISQTGNTYQVAAITVVFPIFTCLSAVANLFGIGGGSLISQSLGIKDYEKVHRASVFSFWASVAITAAISLAMLFFGTPLLVLLGATDNTTLAFAKDYMFWTVIIGGLPTALNMLLAHLVRAVGQAKHSSIGMSLGGILNIILDPIFIFPFGFGLEIRGAALATCISNVVATCYYLFYLATKRKGSVLSLNPKYLMLKNSPAREIISIGLPSAFLVFLAMVSNMVLNHLMANYTPSAIAAVGIVKKIDTVPAFAVQGLATGVLPLFAYNYTAKNRERIKSALRFSVIINFAIMTISLAFIEIFAPQIMLLFIDNAQTISCGIPFMRLHCMAMPFLGVTYVFMAFFQATGRSGSALVLSLFRKGTIDIPLMILLDIFWPMTGIMAVQPFLDTVCALIAFAYYFRFNKTDSAECL